MTTLIPKYDLKNGGTTPSGAINRPFNEKLNEVLSVKDFGAIGNGTTDDTAAIQATINSALVSGTTNGYRAWVHIPKGAYKITASLKLGPLVTTNTSFPFVIQGDGQSTLIINNAPANNPTFDMSGASEWSLRDMLLVGSSTYPNDGILVDGTTVGAIRWNIDRVVTQMAGIGIHLKNTNSGLINFFQNWPDSNANSTTPYWTAAQVTLTDVDHGIYMDGDYCHDITMISADCVVRPGFKANACGIRCNTNFKSINIRILGAVVSGYAADTTRNGIYLQKVQAFTVLGVYHEYSNIYLQTASHGLLANTSSANLVGSLTLNGNSVNNMIQGVVCGTLDLSDDTCTSNYFEGCSFSTAITLSASEKTLASNIFQQMYQWEIGTYGGVKRKVLTYGTTVTPDCTKGNLFSINVTDSVAFTIATPLNPSNGMCIKINVKNTSGGAMGTITWAAIYTHSTWTNPANGYNRTIEFFYDGSAATWVQCSQTGVDIPN